MYSASHAPPDTGTLPARWPGTHRSPTGTVLLNMLLPGAGYVYCGRWLTGLLAFGVCLLLAELTGGWAYAVLLPLLALDGYRTADAVNRDLPASRTGEPSPGAANPSR